jgi:hypothetical protein
MIQVNTFSKGLNFDIDLSMVPGQQYIYAENVKIIGDGTSFALTGRDPMYKFSNAIIGTAGAKVIGSTVVGSYGIVFIYVPSTQYNYVYRVSISGTTASYTQIVAGKLSFTTRLSLVGNYESEENINVYFTVGLTPISIL